MFTAIDASQTWSQNERQATGISENFKSASCRWNKRYYRNQIKIEHLFFFSEENFEDPVLHRKIDIGFPFLRPSRTAELKQRLDHLKTMKKDSSLEKLARSNKCEFYIWTIKIEINETLQSSITVEINLDEVKEDWLRTAGPFHIRKIAEHYGVFEHLFGKHAFFTPRVCMEIRVSKALALVLKWSSLPRIFPAL